MSDWRKLNPRLGGLVTEARQIGEDEFEFRHSQDVSGLVEQNKAMRNAGDGYTKSREMRRVASIPMILIEKWKNEEGIDVFNPDHAVAVARKLNSSDFAFLRTADGTLGVSNGVIR